MATADAVAMAEVATAAIRQAAADCPSGDRSHWWSLPSRWSGLTAYRTPDGVSWWETHACAPGRIRLRHEDAATDRARIADVAETLATLDGIEGSRRLPWSRTLTLDYQGSSIVPRHLVDDAERARRDAERAARFPDADVANGFDDEVEVVTGFRRIRYLILAGGSFVLTVVGLIVPGVPTVPFLLATGYYLARSSPRLNALLRRTPVFGPILDEWERHHALSGRSKAGLLGLTAAIVVVTIAVSAAAPVAVVVILVIAALSAYGVLQLPGIPGETPAAIAPAAPGRLALASS